MKVLVVVSRLDRGGAELLECELAIQLSKLGIETHLAGQFNENTFEGKKYASKYSERGLGRNVYWLKYNNGALATLYNLWKLIKNGQYNFIITHNSGLNILIGIMGLYFKFGHIIAFHACFSRKDSSFFRFHIWKYFIKRGAHSYAITNFVRENVKELFELKNNKITTVYNAINGTGNAATYVSIREELGLNPECKLIVCAGRMNATKGFDSDIEIFNQIQTEAALLFVGNYTSNDEETYYNGLRSKAQNTHKSKHIFFLGYRKDILSIFSQSNLFLHLSRNEGFGLVLLEAIYAKIPVIASDIGGIPEVLQNTPYRPFGANKEKEIVEKIDFYLNMTEGEKVAMVDVAYESLAYFSHQRRAEDIKKIIDSL